MADDKPVVVIQEDEFDDKTLKRSRKKWCIGGSIIGLLCLAAVIFGIVW
jgi:hypothetical protein